MKKETIERHDTVIVDGTTGTVARFLPRGRALLTWHDSNGLEHTKTVWLKRCEVLISYNDK